MSDGLREHRRRRLLAVALRQPGGHVLVGEDLRVVGGGLPGLAGEVAGDDRLARFGHLDIAAGVLGVRVRVDDPADRLVARQLADLLDHLVGEPVGHRIDDEHAVVADLHRGVPAALASIQTLPWT